MTDSRRSTFVAQISALIEQRVGLAQGALRGIQLERVLDDLAAGDLPGFARSLAASGESDPVWQRLLDDLVIGETYFFRSRAHFDVLRAVILPQLLAGRRAHAEPSFTVWSAGCASGEEAYSLAITLRETLADQGGWKLRLIGTDINGRALRAAERGFYRPWSFRQSEPAWRDTYFTPADGGFQLRSIIRQMVLFRQMNVLSGPPVPQCDVIFCRNVLLYFAEHPARAAEDQLYDALAPGGWLLLGQAETIRHARDRWTTHLFPGAVVYQKPVGRPQSTVYHRPPRSVSTRDLTPFAPLNHYADAVTAIRLKQYDEAGRLLAALLQAQPEDPPARTLLACLFANRGAVPEALEQLDRVLKADPMYADAHYLKGVLLLENGEESGARAALRAALYCRRGHALASMILGHLFVKAGEGMRARRVWMEALHELESVPSDQPCSDLSDMTAGSVRAFLKDQLDR